MNVDDIMGAIVEYSSHIERKDNSNEAEILEQLLQQLQLLLSPPQQQPVVEDRQDTDTQITIPQTNTKLL